MDALLATLDALWPGTGGVPMGPELVVVPHSRAPRLLVPAEPRAAAAAALRRYSSALGAGEACLRLGASALLRTGSLSAFPHRVRAPGSEGSISDHLEQVLGEPVVCSVSVGTERASRKPVLQVLDHSGRSLAFVKVGATPLAERLVELEHRHLLTLAEHPLPGPLQVPEVIWCGRWRGLLVLVVSDLRPSLRSTWRGSHPPAPRQLMEELARTFEQPPATLRTTTTWREAHRVRDALVGRAQGDQLAEALASVEGRVGTEPVPIGAWHGDWTSWNMGRRGRRVLVWDWEQFAQGVPVGLDHLHYLAYARCRRDGFTASAVLAGVREASTQARMTPSRSAVLTSAYLVTLATRSLEGALLQDHVGARRAADVSMEALRTWVGR
jgi:hypothetical protein